MRATVPFLRDELARLAASGADVVQIDDPHLCLFVDPRVRGEYEDPDRELALAVDLIADVVADSHGPLIALHLCRRNRGSHAAG